MMLLFYYELKKIFKKRSTWITFLVVLVLQAFLGFSNFINDFLNGGSASEIRESGHIISGRTLDDALLAEVQTSREKLQSLSDRYWESEIYLGEILPYEDLYYILSQTGTNLMSAATAEEILEARAESVRKHWETYGLSESEKEYWEKQESQLPADFTYEYAYAYQDLISMSGFYMTCMILTFFSAVCMVSVFTEEESLKTDQLLLSSRYGRGSLYAAKLTAGCTVSLLATLLLSAVNMLGKFLYYGTDGFEAHFQMSFFFLDSRDMSIGQVMLIMFFLLLLSSLITGLAAMLLALALHHSVGAMAILVAFLFASRLIPIPQHWRLLSQFWNLIPINLLKADQGFIDPRLFRLFGLRLTSYQFAPILYLLIAAGLIFLGWRAYCPRRPRK